MAIREVVFIEEQSVPEVLERDSEDGAKAYHVLALRGGHALGTGRLVDLHEQAEHPPGRWGRIGRMAVLKAHRRKGLGAMVLTALEAEAAKRGLTGLVLHAQINAMPFYQKHGYIAEGRVFQEAGLPHIEMKKRMG